MGNIRRFRFRLVEAVIHAGNCEETLHNKYNNNQKNLKWATADFFSNGFYSPLSASLTAGFTG